MGRYYETLMTILKLAAIALVLATVVYSAPTTKDTMPEDLAVPETEEVSRRWYAPHAHVRRAIARYRHRAKTRRLDSYGPGKKGYPCFNHFPCYVLSKVSWKEKKFGHYMLKNAIAPAMTKAISSVAVCPAGPKAVYKHLRFDNAASWNSYQALVGKGFNAYNPETHEGHCGWPPADKGPVPYPGPDWKRMKFVHSRCNLLTKHG